MPSVAITRFAAGRSISPQLQSAEELLLRRRVAELSNAIKLVGTCVNAALEMPLQQEPLDLALQQQAQGVILPQAVLNGPDNLAQAQYDVAREALDRMLGVMLASVNWRFGLQNQGGAAGGGQQPRFT